LHAATSIGADMAAADNDKMPRQKIDLHHRRIRQVGHFAYAGHWRHQCPAADIDEDASGVQPRAGDCVACHSVPGVLTFVRSAWGNGAASVTADQVKALRPVTDPSSDRVIILKMR
jgi:hypothetical protein